jgi:Rps23 Pro-64 3,4-dihydroxylase Tpa1-like proline 4-hydroxylase
MPVFLTNRKESWKTRRFRWMMNCFPTYFGTGGRILFISSDWREIHIRLSLNLFTYNYVGVVYGGSIYSAIDPFYMLQLIHILGKAYVVWDKAATIRFLRPIKKKVYARFLIDEVLIEKIKQQIAQTQEMEITLPVEWIDKEGNVYAHIDKVLYIASKEYYKQKRSRKQPAKPA